MPFELIVAIALVLANGFFVATEFAIARLRPTQVEEFERAGRPGAASVRHAVDHIDAYLAACQLGITVASLGLGVVGKPVFEELFHGVLGDAAPIAGFGLVGDPRLRADHAAARGRGRAVAEEPRHRAHVFDRAVGGAADAALLLRDQAAGRSLQRARQPPAQAVRHSARARGRATRRTARTSCARIMRQSRSEGLIDREDQELTENVFAFGDRRVREVMTPRGEIDFAHSRRRSGARRSRARSKPDTPGCRSAARTSVSTSRSG